MNKSLIQSANSILIARDRISQYIYITPLIQSSILNNALDGHEVFFKVDSLQKTGAFKVRGVLNHLLELKERDVLPLKVVAYSTGNHGLGLAWVSKILNIKARIYLPKNTSKLKQKAAKYYGAEVIITNSRQEAETKAKLDINNGFYYIHPSDNDLTIAGAGTMCYEAIKQLEFQPDAIFASCGGGGLLSGTYLAKELISPSSLIIASEPLLANDAYLSKKQNNIFRFKESPDTIADGLRTLGLSERTFHYIKKIDDFFLIKEKSICYWTAWLTHLLKIFCEPSCALNMEAVVQWLKKQQTKKRVLVLISGGNIDPNICYELSKKTILLNFPSLNN